MIGVSKSGFVHPSGRARARDFGPVVAVACLTAALL